MKIINVLVLALVMSVSACNKKDKDRDDSSGSGSKSPPTSQSTSGSGSGNSNPPPEWDPDAEPGWGDFPDWGEEEDDTSGDSSGGGTSGESTSGINTGGTSGSTDPGTTSGTTTSGTGGTTSSGSTSGSVDSGSTSGGETGSTTAGSTSGTTTSGSTSGGESTTGETASGATAGTTTSGDASAGSTSGSGTDGTTTSGETTSGSTGGVGSTTTTGGSSGGTVPEEDVLPPGYGYLSIKVTDAPFPFDWIVYAKVTIEKLQMRNASTQMLINAYNDLPVEFDLLPLKNGVTAFFVKAKMPAAEYDQAKLFISKAEVKLKDGRVFNIVVPNGATTGVSIVMSPTIRVYPASESQMLLDIDVAKSFTPIGSSTNMTKATGFKYSTVARASNISASGTIFGKVANDNGTPSNPADDRPISGAVIRVARMGQTIVSAVTSSKGEYRIIGVPQESYSVLYAASGFESKEYGPINVVANKSVEVNARLASTPEVIVPLSVHVIKSQIVKGTTDIVAEVTSYNGAVTLEATNRLSVKIVFVQGRVYIAAKAGGTGISKVTVTDKKGQTSSFEISQVAN